MELKMDADTIEKTIGLILPLHKEYTVYLTLPAYNRIYRQVG